MSMSQEEIESLMNGLDFDNDSSDKAEVETKEDESQKNVSEDDINELISQTENISNEVEESSEESVDEILASLENNTDIEEKNSNDTNIDDILKEFEINEVENVTEKEEVETSSIEEKPSVSEEVTNDNIDDLLASFEDTTSAVKIDENVVEDDDDDIDLKINSGVFPLPVEEDTKVVNQLSAVANDSEEKATKIFDVLSNILDYNGAIQNDIHALNSFNEKQVAMLSSLSEKFPNIDAFKQNLDHAQQMADHIKDANEKLNDGNTEIFQAMELMQYHDINRQKIERVMSVIRKLSVYLNNLFEDEGNRDEVAVAKHIHGDNTADLVDNEDLEALIAEFNK